MSEQNTDVKSLVHTKWNCKYHIVFAPKYRRRSMLGSYSFTSEYPAQNERFGGYGVFEGKEQSDDISEIREYEICIPKPRVLVQGILCRYSREEHSSNKKLHSQSAKARSGNGTDIWEYDQMTWKEYRLRLLTNLSPALLYEKSCHTDFFCVAAQ